MIACLLRRLVGPLKPRGAVLLFCILASLNASAGAPTEAVIVARIRYVFALRAAVDSCCWNSFNEPRYAVPLIYYTDSTSYIANPTAKFLRLVPSVAVAESPGLRIYRSLRRVDDRPFHMATGYESGDGDSAAIFNYEEPFMACSGYQETQRQIPDVLSVEQWATMVIHEYFHGFQFRHPATFSRAQRFLYLSSDTLLRIYKTNDWFKAMADRENAYLLAALAAPTRRETNAQLDSFYRLRSRRRETLLKKQGFDIGPLESYYELLEGTARYAEFGLYGLFTTRQPDSQLASVDTGFHSYAYFHGYRIEKDPWLYEAGKTTYFYATGFNMVRLLDKLGIDFRKTVFDRERPLETLLRTAR